MAASPQLLSLRSDGELARTAVGAVHRTLQETPAFKLVDDQADIVAIDTERFGKRLLADARHVVDEDQQGKFKLHQLGVRQRFGDHRQADLLQSPHQRGGRATDRNAIARHDEAGEGPALRRGDDGGRHGATSSIVILLIIIYMMIYLSMATDR